MNALEHARMRQRSGADPARSVFVMANAGSGKTRVLTERVARMLVGRVDPQQILCITFTKAAASEMSERLFKTLGRWALVDDAELRADLAEIEGAEIARSESELSEIRRLFARALETPGGLKIQTIHSFCESLLKRFPIEAGVTPGFSVIEEVETAHILSDTIDEMARASANDDVLDRDIARLSICMAEQDLRAQLSRGAKAGLMHAAMMERYGGLDTALGALAEALDVNHACTDECIRNEFLNSLDRMKLEAASEALMEGGVNAEKLAKGPLAAFLNTADNAEQWAAFEAFALTSAGTPRKNFTDKKIDSLHPWLGPYLAEAQERFVAAATQLKAAAVFHDTAAYMRLTARLRSAYGGAKAARAALDFDDLILGARRLLKNEAAAWVRYKLDFGIDHVLVDETQDTSPEQWSVIGAMLDDYLSGDSARELNRTFFAVGDVKQSIYSFQGADADVFEEQETELGKALAAYHARIGGAYEKIDMQMSFRTTAPVLEFVDTVFRKEDAHAGLGKEGAPQHFIKRAGEAGRVELWPLTPRCVTEKANAWDAPVDASAPDHPVERLARRVAETISGWLRDGEALESQGRPVRPEDILILVQRRGQIFDSVLRALAVCGAPVAGADRLKLLEDPAVEDLLSYMKFCAQPRDNLSLAETLKSPLFGFDDDADLFPLAYERGRQESLWASLCRRADERPHWREAQARIAAAKSTALREGAYGFLMHVLETGLVEGAPSGRRLFHARLSKASREGVDEMLRQALTFERAHPRSVRVFIGWFQENAVEIKREMERSDNAVRVMTVHGAKGLEANIVFLIDADRSPPGEQAGAPIELVPAGDKEPRTGRLRVLAGAKKNDPEAIAASRIRIKAKTYEEYRRLFYVAATRARDRLYVAGVESGKVKDPQARDTLEKSWHALSVDAFQALGPQVETDADGFWPESDAPRCWLSSSQTAAIEDEEAWAPAPEIKTPPWLNQAAAKETAPVRLTPSRLAEEEEAQSETVAQSDAAYSPVAGGKYFRGRILHRLLELLPDIDQRDRASAANRLLARLAADLDPAERERWRDEVFAVLDSPDFAPVFGPGSRAEVSVAGKVSGSFVGGQIDRLLVTDDAVLIVDYKSNRPPPSDPAATAPAYLAQMAAYRELLQKIYPGRKITCALLWTFEARLMTLPDLLLDEARKRWLAPG